MSGKKSNAMFEPSGFFVLRTPLLPFDELEVWSGGLEAVEALSDREGLPAAVARDRAVLRHRLVHTTERKDLHEALFVASPSLAEAAEAWIAEMERTHGRYVADVFA